MATDYSKVIPSGSTNGKAIAIAATATPGTSIHTAVTGVVSIDEVWIYAANIDTVDHTLTIEWGGVTTADHIIVPIAAKQGLALIIPGLPLNNGLIVRAFADLASKINVVAFINRISVL